MTTTPGSGSSAPAPHGCPAAAEHDREVPQTDLLSPWQVRGVRLRNRVVMSPMCQYSADEGLANDWHLVHLGSRAAGGVALVFVEATAVTRDGRISPGDMGIWSDDHVEPLARIARFVRSQGAVPAIQLAHAGRKASCDLPWRGGAPLSEDQGGWRPVWGPSPLAFDEASPVPQPLDQAGIDRLIDAFESAAARSIAAGFEILEIHAAHGYLLHEFLSPLSNQRTDQYGGSLENRARFLLEVTDAAIEVWGADRVGVHLSPRDMEHHSIADSDPAAIFNYVAGELGKRKIAFIFVRESVDGGPRFGPAMKKAFGGLFIANEQHTLESAEKVLASGEADAISWGQLFLANPDLPRRFELNAPLNTPNPATFYAPGATGYTDYPFLDLTVAAA
jgi:2,4-dienoyl-CoA reductase-like NADH-dependent reductase (Old Yellow Enzyme family)